MVWRVTTNSNLTHSLSLERDIEANTKDPNGSNPDLNKTASCYGSSYPKFTSLWVSPFQKMETHERNLRICFFTGIFPLPVLGCLIGSIYGACLGKKKKRIHDKLHSANLISCVVYLFLAAILGSLVLFHLNSKLPATPRTVTNLVKADGNEYFVKATDNGFKNNLLLIEHGSGILPEVLPDARKYKFNVFHVTVVELEDKSSRDDVVWESIAKALKLEPKNTLLTTTVEEEKAEELKDAKLDQWMGLLLMNDANGAQDDRKFMVQFVNKKLLCSGKETWMFSTIRPSGAPNYYITREKALEVLTDQESDPKGDKDKEDSDSDNKGDTLKSESPQETDKLAAVQSWVESVASEAPMSEDLIDSICAMSSMDKVPSNQYVKL